MSNSHTGAAPHSRSCCCSGSRTKRAATLRMPLASKPFGKDECEHWHPLDGYIWVYDQSDLPSTGIHSQTRPDHSTWAGLLLLEHQRCCQSSPSATSQVTIIQSRNLIAIYSHTHTREHIDINPPPLIPTNQPNASSLFTSDHTQTPGTP